MEKLPMCRICLVEDVRMYVVVNKNLHELYEKLTDVPFVTKDRRPMLACFFCCAKLKQCWKFLRKCLEAEELFTQMMNEDYEQDPLINSERLEFFNGLINSPIVHVIIGDAGQIESDAIKEELPDVNDGLHDIFDPLMEKEHQSNELDNAYPDAEDTRALHAESDSEDVPLKEIKSEVEDEPESTGAPVSKKSKLDTRSPRDTISVEQKKNEKSPKLSCVPKITHKKIQKQNMIKISRTAKFKVPFTKTQHEVSCSINNTNLSTSFQNNSNRDEIKCKISNKGVDSDDIQKYRRVCAKEKRFKCDFCQRGFSTNSDLTRHIRTHTGEKPFKCDLCQRRFTCKKNLVMHTRTHTGEKPFKCDLCQRSFTCRITLVIHTRTHTGEKPFKCDVCQRSFTQKTNLKNHTHTHTGEKRFKCDLCQRRFTCKGNLVIHTRTHTGEKPFKCDVCQRSFTQKTNLKNHIRTHTGEKPFKCDVCQRSFNKKINLTTHYRTHTGEKRFKCVICQRGFNTKSNLTRHIRNHNGEKPFKCDICQRRFTCKKNLVMHTRTHTGEKPFKCDVCQRSFSVKSNLTVHTRRHTGEKP